jgi:hypothetical protein
MLPWNLETSKAGDHRPVMVEIELMTRVPGGGSAVMPLHGGGEETRVASRQAGRCSNTRVATRVCEAFACLPSCVFHGAFRSWPNKLTNSKPISTNLAQRK